MKLTTLLVSALATGALAVSASATPAPQVLDVAQAPIGIAATKGKSEARKALEALPVKGRAPKTGYKRSAFGYAWKDVDRNGCDTRNDILRRDLSKKKYQGKKKCVVTRGTLKEPYTGKKVTFKRGVKTSSAVQIDHIVALSDAWQKGAQNWDRSKREKFANDPLNLAAVDGKQNAQKGDGDAATWLPKNKKVRCEYVARQITVKKKYNLWVTKAERSAMAKLLNNCPKQKLADGSKGFKFSESKNSDKGKKGKTPPKKSDPRFSTCGEAKKRGYGPYYRGKDKEYAWYQDRDSDGVVCE